LSGESRLVGDLHGTTTASPTLFCMHKLSMLSLFVRKNEGVGQSYWLKACQFGR
jgi:hypothetical protein